MMTVGKALALVGGGALVLAALHLGHPTIAAVFGIAMFMILLGVFE